MSRKRMLPIDGEKLRKLIEATDKTLADASEQLGYSRKYLGEACKDGRIPVQMASLIGLALNIPQDLYVIPDPEDAMDPEDAQPEGSDNSVLYEILQELKTIRKLLDKNDVDQKTWALPFENE